MRERNENAAESRDRYEKVLKWIADPIYVGNYEDATVIKIYREWAAQALRQAGVTVVNRD